jgi:two-component sensor histidine kinase
MKTESDEYYWRPLSFDFLISKYGLRSKKVLWVLAGWSIFTAILVYATILLHQINALNLTADDVDILSIVAFNPIYIIGILLLLWFGFEWGFIPVYICTFVATILSGVSVIWATIISLAFVLGLLFFALAYHSFRISYSLRSIRSFTVFILISFLAALASSLGSFIWSFFHQFPAADTLIYWKRWWTGTFFQSIIIVAPLLYLLTPGIEKIKSRFFKLPAIKEISIGWIYGSVTTIALTLFLFVLSSYILGRSSLNQLILHRDISSADEIIGALGAFEIIAWTSFGLIVITAAAAIYLLNNWNHTLRKEVESRTHDLNENRKMLQQSLKEKDILFKEIQHRVKNNLSQVHGLLELQETMSDDHKVAELLKISKSRIRTMSLAHEALYDSEDFSKISFKKYIQRIGDITHISFMNSSKKLALVYNIEDFNIDMAKAIPLGLMVSEILINAHKHAFSKKNQGSIEITCRVSDPNLLLQIRDNGSGLPADLDIRNNNSLGMILIDNFTRQLKGELDIDSSANGTGFLFKIPLISIYGK